jgi:hypothetical protein
MNNNTINRLTPHRIFYNWSNGDAETFTKDLTATGHFNRQDVDGLMQNTLENLWVLEQQLEDFLESENYKF